MTNDLSQTHPFADILQIVAVLGRADTAAVMALLGAENAAAMTLPATLLAQLTSHSAVQEEAGWWGLAPKTALTILTDLAQADLPRYHHWHERALFYLSERLHAREPRLEPSFIAVFERWANRLLLDDEDHFTRLVDSVRDVPLSQSDGQQLRRYFQGLALGLQDNYLEALAVFDELLAEPNLVERVRGRTLNSRAFFCITLGRLEEALTGHQASLALWRQLGDRLHEGKTLVNLGFLFYELRRYDQAEAVLTQARRCFEEVNVPEQLLFAQNALGLVYRDQGRWGEALACFEAVAAQWQDKALGLAHNNIGEVLLFQGRLTEAAAAFQAALAILQEHTYAVDAHLHLGLVYQASDDLWQAQTAFQKALDLALTIGRRDILAETHYRLGEVLRRLGQDEAALAQFAAGVAVIEANRTPLRDEGLKISLLGRWQQIYEALVLHCLALDRLDEAFVWAEHVRARAFGEAVASSAAHHSPATSQMKPEETEQLQSTVALAWPDATTVATVAEIQAALPADTILLSYFTTGVLEQEIPLLRHLSAHNPVREHLLVPARTLLFILSRTDLRVRECPLDPNAFVSTSPRQDQHRRFLSPTILRRLSEKLLTPAGEALQARNLYLIPHGPLHHVPFEALTDQQGRPLVRKGGATLAYAPSATVLLRHCLGSGSGFQVNGHGLAIGYDGKQGRLRHTEAEAEFVARLTGGQARVGPQPKKMHLQQQAGRQHWLHFACHGQFNYAVPLDSYLEIGAEERLTAMEILQTWQLQTELVTLSACQTGVSQILRGDEPLGLIRALLIAGAKAALVSRWPVEDLPTFLFMQHFYRALQQTPGLQPAAALQLAQIWLRELTTTQVQQLQVDLPNLEIETLAGLSPTAQPFSQPRHWAAFRLVGKI